MYCTELKVFGNRAMPLALGALYEHVAEHYTLPSLELLMKSLKEDVQWPGGRDNRLQVYYLDSLTEANEKDIFQVRFSSAKDSRDLVSLFLSVEQSIVKNMTVQFPGRLGRGAFSVILGAVKSVSYQYGDLEFEAQGFAETGNARYIREHSLSAFVWIAALSRYLHIREDPRQLDEVRRGHRSL